MSNQSTFSTTNISLLIVGLMIGAGGVFLVSPSTQKSVINNLESQLSDLNFQVDSLTNDINDLEAENARHETEASSLESQVTSLRTEVHLLNVQIFDLESNIVTAEDTILQDEITIAELENSVVKRDDIIDELSDKIINYEGKIKNLENVTNILKSKMLDTENLVDTFNDNDNVLLLIPVYIYSEIESEIKNYIDDISDFDIIIKTGIWNNHTEVKNMINDFYNYYNISGCILIGDIPIAYYEMIDERYGYLSYPVDIYYMDIDGEWLDNDSNNIYDHRNDPTGIEIWVSRIKPPIFTKVQSILLIKEYFIKNYYTRNNINNQTKALAFMKNDESGESCEFALNHRVNILDNIYGRDDIDVLCGENATKINFIALMNNTYETVWISCHGGPTRQLIEEKPAIWFDYTDAKLLEQGGILYLVHSCESGPYDTENYIAGWYIFGDSVGITALASTTIWESIDHDSFLFYADDSYVGNAFYNIIREADLLSNTNEIIARNLYYGATLLGDPLITIGN